MRIALPLSAALMGASTLPGKWSMLGLAPLALFSRVGDDDVLVNPVRRRINDTIATSPGVGIQAVRASVGVAWGTAVHHLARLERHGLVVSQRSGLARLYYPANSDAARRRRELSVVAHPTAQRIARLILQQPGIDQKAICTQLGLRNPAASKHLGRLEREGLVATQRVMRHCHYEPTPALPAIIALQDGAVRPVPYLTPGVMPDNLPAGPGEYAIPGYGLDPTGAAVAAAAAGVVGGLGTEVVAGVGAGVGAGVVAGAGAAEAGTAPGATWVATGDAATAQA